MTRGAGTSPAGLYPAGLDAPTGAVSSGHATTSRGAFLDPSTGRWGLRDTGGELQELDPIDAKVAFLLTIPRGSLPVSPATGHTFYARRKNATDATWPTEARLAADETFADLLANGDIRIDDVIVDVRVKGDVEVRYTNLRAAQSSAPTRPS